MKKFANLSVLLISISVLVSCDEITQIKPETCNDLAPHIIELSEENHNVFSPGILKMYDIQNVEPTDYTLECIADAKWSTGGTSPLRFHMETDGAGDTFIGYERIDKNQIAAEDVAAEIAKAIEEQMAIQSAVAPTQEEVAAEIAKAIEEQMAIQSASAPTQEEVAAEIAKAIEEQTAIQSAVATAVAAAVNEAIPTGTPFGHELSTPSPTHVPTWTPVPTFTPEPTSTPTLTLTPTITPTPVPTFTPEPTWTPVPTFTPEPTSAPTSTPTPKAGLGPGTYQVGIDIQPGIYAGKPGTGILDLCYWERLRGISGEFSDIIANNILSAVGQIYVEILPTDKYFKVDYCDIIPLDKWPTPAEPLSEIEPGTYLVGRDIAPGTYRGEAGALDLCLWNRLSGISGEFHDLIDIDAPTGQYFVRVPDTDYALSTTCVLELVEP